MDRNWHKDRKMGWMDRQTNGERTDRWTNQQKDRQKDGHTARLTDKPTKRRTQDRWTNGQAERRTDRQTHRWTDKPTEEQTDSLMDRLTERGKDG